MREKQPHFSFKGSAFLFLFLFFSLESSLLNLFPTLVSVLYQAVTEFLHHHLGYLVAFYLVDRACILSPMMFSSSGAHVLVPFLTRVTFQDTLFCNSMRTQATRFFFFFISFQDRNDLSKQ